MRAHFEVGKVSENDGIRWSSNWVNVRRVIPGESVDLKGIDDDLWEGYFGPLKLGRWRGTTLRIEDALGRM